MNRRAFVLGGAAAAAVVATHSGLGEPKEDSALPLFARDFLFGAATSSVQIEGASREDGKGDSIWDRFATKPGAIADGSIPSVACDSYHRWRSDEQLSIKADSLLHIAEIISCIGIPAQCLGGFDLAGGLNRVRCQRVR